MNDKDMLEKALEYKGDLSKLAEENESLRDELAEAIQRISDLTAISDGAIEPACPDCLVRFRIANETLVRERRHLAELKRVREALHGYHNHMRIDQQHLDEPDYFQSEDDRNRAQGRLEGMTMVVRYIESRIQGGEK